MDDVFLGGCVGQASAAMFVVCKEPEVGEKKWFGNGNGGWRRKVGVVVLLLLVDTRESIRNQGVE